MERTPDFEDERVRLWKEDPAQGELPPDPSVLHVNADTERPYESRVYRLDTQSPRFGFLLQETTSSLRTGLLVPGGLAKAMAADLLEDAVLKFLSKQHRETGVVSLLVVGTTLGFRALLRPIREYSVATYRQQVHRFERDWVARGPFVAGPIIAPSDWDAYRSEGE